MIQITSQPFLHKTQLELRWIDTKTLFGNLFYKTGIFSHIYICKRDSEKQVQSHFNPIEYIQCPEFSTTPAVFISGTTSTEVNKLTLLSEVTVATVRMCKSNVKGVWVEGEVYHLRKYMHSVRKSKVLA